MLDTILTREAPEDIHPPSYSDFARVAGPRHGPATYDAETRTLEVVAATESPVTRQDGRGQFREVLDMATLDLSAIEGKPVLDSHRSGSVRDTLGVIERARIEDNQLVLTIRMSSATDAAPAVERVADGTLRNVSVGYSVASWTESTEDGKRTKRPAAWIVREVSFTSNPADPHARVRQAIAPEEKARSGGNSKNRAITQGGNMPDTIETTAPDKSAEQTRRADIRTLCRTAGLPSETADQLIDDNATIDEAKAAAFDAMQKRTAPVIRSTAPANDDPAVIATRQADVLHYRMSGGDLPAEARQYAEDSLFDMARNAVERSGASTRAMSRDEVLHRAAHSTSDFPLLVSNAVGKTAMDSYRAAESPLKTLCRKTTLRDFKTSTAMKLGEMGELQEMQESGEFKATTRGETGEEIALKTYGRRIDLSRNLIINDDLNLLGDTTRAFGEAAAQTEATLLVAQIVGNPNLRDGTPVFDAGRGNIGTPASPSKASLSEAREFMRKRTGTDGETLIDAKPAYMLVPAELETEAEEILASIQPNTVDDVNVFSGKLKLLVEPRLDDGMWYLFSDPARLASMRYAHLAGAEGVQIQRREAFDTLGLSFRAYLDFGAGWLDWRGAQQVATA